MFIQYHWIHGIPIFIPLKVTSLSVKKQPSQDVLHGDEAGEELGLARLVSSYTLSTPELTAWRKRPADSSQ